MEDRSQKQGFAMIQVVIATAVLATAMGTTGVFIGQAIKNSGTAQMQLAADRVLHRMENMVRQPANLQSDPSILACSRIDGANDCAATANWRPMALRTPDGQLLAGIGGEGQARYGLNEDSCTGQAASRTCPFEADMMWKADCGGAATCDQSRIAIRAEVRLGKNGGDTVNYGGSALKFKSRVAVYQDTIPPVTSDDYAAMRGAAIDPREVATVGKKDCPVGLFKGVDEKGSVICNTAPSGPGLTSCGLHSFVKGVNFASSSVDCSSIVFDTTPCPANQYFRGYNNDGSKNCDNIDPYIVEEAKTKITTIINNRTAHYCAPHQVAIGVNANNEPACQRLAVKLGTISNIGKIPVPVDKYVDTGWRPCQAFCAVNLNNWVGLDGHQGVCQCWVSGIEQARVRFQMQYYGGAFVNPAQEACSFSYIVLGEVNGVCP